MPSEFVWMREKRKGTRVLFAGLNAPPVVLACHHDVDYRDYAPRGVPERSRDAYGSLREAAITCGLVDEGVPLPRTRKDEASYVWGDRARAQMLADAALNKEHAEKYAFGLAPASVLVFSDPNHETFMLVISDIDDCFPERVYTWGPHSGRRGEEVEAALAAYRERNPVPDW